MIILSSAIILTIINARFSVQILSPVSRVAYLSSTGQSATWSIKINEIRIQEELRWVSIKHTARISSRAPDTFFYGGARGDFKESSPASAIFTRRPAAAPTRSVIYKTIHDNQ